MNIKRSVTLLLILSLPLVASTEASDEQSDLELFAFITTVEKATYLNLRITNRGLQKLTVPTGKPALSSTMFPNILIRHDILTMGPAGEPEKWKVIPSLTDLAPVTIHKGETAVITHKLMGEAWSDSSALAKHTVNIEYMVSKEIAKRFSFWQGSLKMKDSLKSLRNRQ
jgi:hypothetical protein